MVRHEIRFWFIHGFYIFFFFFLLHRIFFSSSDTTERTMSYFLYPFVKIHASISQSLHQKSQHRQNVQAMQKELQALQIQNDILKGYVAQLQALQIFTEQSAEVVDYAQRYSVEHKKIAKVLFQLCSEQEDIILIEGGVNQAILKDDVVVYQNSLVGRVIEVYNWYSKVALITDKRCKVSGQNNSAASGICCGKNNKELEFCFVPHYKKIIEGDLIISTGQGLVYPAGFALGIVQSVTTDLVSHRITLKPYFDIKNISYVYVFCKQETKKE